MSKLIEFVDKYRLICIGYILYIIVFWYDSILLYCCDSLLFFFNKVLFNLEIFVVVEIILIFVLVVLDVLCFIFEIKV